MILTQRKEMDTHFSGLGVWSEHQSKSLPLLRKLTCLDQTEVKKEEEEKGEAEVKNEAVQDRAVVFVEPRKHPSSEFVLRNLRHFLPLWKIIVVHGTENEEFMKLICSSIKGNFGFINAKVSNLPNQSYNTLFTAPAFWDLLPPKVLIAQTDTLLMKPATEEIEGLLSKYSFVGAPWSYLCQRCQKPLVKKCGHMIDQEVVCSLSPSMVGNGGLSLRDSKVMKDICLVSCLDSTPCPKISQLWKVPSNRTILKGTTNEDVFFCKSIVLRNLPMPSRQEALEFAIEQVGPLSWSDSPAIGMHKPWVYLPLTLVSALFEQIRY
jgi:hypothetical protein